MEIIFFALFLFFLAAKNVDAATINKPPNYLSSNNGLVGYWTMDGSRVNWATGAVTDSSGKGNTGTIVNMATSTGVAIGKIGQALEFSQAVSNDHVSYGSPSLYDDMETFTVSLWIYPNVRADGFGSRQQLVDKGGDSSTGWGFMYGGTDSGDTMMLRFDVDHATTDLIVETSNNTIQLNQWQYVAVTWASSTVSNLATDVHIYINGTEASYKTQTNASGARLSDSDRNLLLGMANTFPNVQFSGILDDFRLYNRALSANEINTLFNSGAAKFNVSPTKYLTDGLVGYWTMDGSKVNWATGAVTDSSGRGNTGTIKNMATSTGVAAGKIGQALNFDGVDDIVEVTSDTYDNMGAITVSAWIKPNGYGENNRGRIVDKANGTTPTNGWILMLTNANANTASFIIDGSTDLSFGSSVGSVQFGVWTHIAITWNGNATCSGNAVMYINGVADTICSSSLVSRADDSAEILKIGNDKSLARTFDGLIDEVRVYNRALSANEVSALYNSGAAKFNVSPTKYLTDGLVGYWTMDGSKVNWGTGAVTDSSGQGNTGFVKNMATSTSQAIGRIGQALNFDGVNDAVHTNSFTLPNTFSVSAWVKVISQSANYPRIAETAYNAGFYLGLDTTGDPGFKWIVNNNVSPFGIAEGGTLTFGKWTHIVGTYDGTTGILFVDGVNVASDTFTNPGSRADAVDIGANSGNTEAFNGLIDEVRVYNRALSADEIQRLYNIGR